MRKFKKEDLKAGYLVVLNTKRGYLLIPNENGLQLVHVNTNPTSLDLIPKHVEIVSWFTDLKGVNDDLTINICGSVLRITKVYGPAEMGRFWSEEDRKLLWEEKPYTINHRGQKVCSCGETIQHDRYKFCPECGKNLKGDNNA